MYYKNLSAAIVKTSAAAILFYKMLMDWTMWWKGSARSVAKKAFFTPSIAALESRTSAFSAMNGLLTDLRKEFSSLVGGEPEGRPYGYIAVTTKVEGAAPFRNVLADTVICSYLIGKFLRGAKTDWTQVYADSPNAQRVVERAREAALRLNERYSTPQSVVAAPISNAASEADASSEADGADVGGDAVVVAHKGDDARIHNARATSSVSR